MEMVAMDMKLRGMYIARQLSFQGVTFRIEEISISENYKNIYNAAVTLVRLDRWLFWLYPMMHHCKVLYSLRPFLVTPWVGVN